MAWFIYPKVLLGVMFPLYIQGQVTAQVNKTYLINLDAAPSERWVALGKDFPQLKPFVKYLIEWVYHFNFSTHFKQHFYSFNMI